MFVIGGNKLSFWKFFGSLNDEEIVGLYRKTIIRDKGDPQTDACKINQQVVAAEFNLRDEIELMLLKQRVKEFACRAFFVQHDDWVIQKLL